MSARIAVLYEDKLATSKPKNFGPHVLVLACVADQTQCERELLSRHVDGLPRKGVGKLLADCAMPLLLDAYAHVLAVVDDDKVRDHLRLPRTACKTQVREAMEAGPCLHAVLLVRNLETVLDSATSVLGRRPLARKPTPLERDGILLHLAYQGLPEQRIQLLEQVPSLKYLVTKLAGLLGQLGLFPPSSGP